MPLPAALAALAPMGKALAAGAGKKALMGAAKQGAKSFLKDKAKDAVKDKAKDFVTGKNRKKKKGKKGKGGDLVKSEGGEGQEQGRGGALVATTPMVGNYRVETPPDKPGTEGKPSQVSFESINNQLESIAGLTEVLKKTSQAKLKTADNRRKTERKAREKSKKRQRESLLEKGAGFIGGAVVGAAKKAAPFDPLKFFTMIFLGSLLMWVMKNGSKIIAALKITLAFINNLPKLMMAGFNALRKGFGLGLRLIARLSPRLAKIGKSVRNIFRAVGSKISKAFRSVGKGITNLAKGIIKRLRDLGKFMMKPFGGKKPPKGTPKSITKLAESTASTGSKTSGKLTNAGRLLQSKHGDEAARMYQGLVDNGMKPSRAAQNVNKAIKSGKLTSQPAAKAGSKVAQKAGQKSILKVTKKGLGFLKRIPVIGSLLTLVVSLLGGDPIEQGLFKMGGAALGGFFGSFIPIPVVGTVIGELIGEYVGDLFYHLIMGGGPEAVGKKLQDDAKAAFETGAKVIGWFRDGFGRMYKGLPKIKFPLINLKVVDFPSLLMNPLQIIPTLYKAFFTRDPMEKGEEETKSGGSTTPTPSGNTTNMNPGRAFTPAAGQRAGDFAVSPDGTLGVWTGQGTRGLKPGERQLYEEGATNIDGTGRRRTLKNSAFKAGGAYYSKETRGFLGNTEEEARAKLSSISSASASASAAKWKPLLDLIAAGESDSSGGYDAMNPNRNTRKEGNPITEMTMRQVRDMAMVSPGGTGAAGRYQIMPEFRGVNVFKKLVEDVGLDYDTSLFTPENQDKMGVHRLAVTRRGNDWLAGKITDDTFGLGISMEWAALKSKSGGYYDHQKRNKATIGFNRVQEAMNQIKGQSQQPVKPVKPQTPVAEPPVKVQPGAPSPQSHPSVPAVPGVGDDKGALKTGLVTGPSAYIGGSAEYHIDTQIMKSVPMRQKIAMVDQMAMGYAAQGRVMEFSNSGVAGETWNVNASYDEKVKLLERVFAAHSHSMYADRNSMDYYIPKKGHGRGHSSAEGAEILAPTVGGASASYASGGGYGNFVEIKDSKGQVIARTGHGDSRVGGGQGTISLDGSRQIASSAVPGASITPPPAAVRPPTETTSPVPSISQSLAYETPGSTVVMMSQPSRGGGVSVGGGGSGTPVIMGSGDVVNSYYKSQLLGFLYKQG